MEKKLAKEESIRESSLSFSASQCVMLQEVCGFFILNPGSVTKRKVFLSLLKYPWPQLQSLHNLEKNTSTPFCFQ